MGRLQWGKLLCISAVCAGLILSVTVCSKKDEAVKPDTSTSKPVLTITTPVADTTVAAAESVIVIKGSISNPDGKAITKLVVNNIDVTENLTDGDSKFAASVKLTADTTSIVASIVTIDNYTARDTVRVTRGVAVLPKSGLATISGVLTKESSTLGKIRRVTTNAQGTQRVTFNDVIPVTGADILVYVADTTSTSSVAHARTDSTGKWIVDSLDPGKYFIFAVYFDVVNRSVITAAIQNVQANADTVVNTGAAIAAEDLINPSVLSMLDATTNDSNGLYLASKIPAGKPILPLSFNEPMDRTLAGDSLKGVVFGLIDTSASSFALVDTIPVEKVWNGNSTELRVIPKVSLDANKAYGIVVPVTLKDLAFNPLQAKAMVMFTTVPIDSLGLFEVAGTLPISNETIQSSSPIIISFSRSPDLISVTRKVTIYPPIRGLFEARGAKVIFTPEAIMTAGTYTLTIPAGVKSVAGDSLTKATSVTFSVGQLTGVAAADGDTGLLAQTVLKGINGYQMGDLAAFASIFDAQMLMVSQWSDDHGNPMVKVETKDEFLRNIKTDLAFESEAREQGIKGPMWYVSDTTPVSLLNRVIAREDVTSFIHVQFMGGGMLGSPRMFRSDAKTEIKASELQFVPGRPEVIYAGKHYAFAPDMSQMGSIAGIENNPIFMGKMYAQFSTVKCDVAKMDKKDNIQVEKVFIKNDTGVVILSMKSVTIWSGATRPWPYVKGVQLPREIAWGQPDTSARAEVVKMKCVRRAGEWFVIRMASVPIWSSDSTTSIPTDAIKLTELAYDQSTFALPPSIVLVSPINKTENGLTGGKVTLKWTKPTNDSLVKGYLVGIAEEPAFTACRPPKGVLIFVPSNLTQVVLKTDGTIDTAASPGAMLITKRPFEIGARTMFQYEMPLDKIEANMVFRWKVLGLKDSTARSIISNSLQDANVVAQSDFAQVKGFFAAVGFPTPLVMDSLCRTNQQSGPIMNNFEDFDRDGVPDSEETRWGTDPRNAASYPRFEIDSDGDHIADFLEVRFGTDPKDPAKKPTTEQLATIGYKDSDNDGFPDEVEGRMGTNSFDPNSNPGTRVAFEAPIGSFTGKIFFGSSSVDLIAKISKDTSAGADERAFIALYKTTSTAFETPEISTKAMFDKFSGEMIFLMELDKEGPDAGMALKLRGKYDPGMGRMGGPIDKVRMADGITGSGPKVADYMTSNRGEEINAPYPGSGTQSGSGGTNNPGMPGRPQNAKDIVVIVSKDANQNPVGKLVFTDNPTDTFASFKGFKSMGGDGSVFIELGFKKTSEYLYFRGQMFRMNPDTVGWSGGLSYEDSNHTPKPYAGGFGCKKADKVEIFGTSNIFSGWIFTDTTVSGGSGPTIGQPPEYVGGVSSFVKEIEAGGIATTGEFKVVIGSNGQVKTVKLDTTTNVLSVAKISAYSTKLNPGCVFVITSTSDTLLVFGADDRSKVQIRPMPDGSKAVMTEMPPPANFNQGPGPGTGPVPYIGDLTVAKDRIMASGNKVWRNDLMIEALVNSNSFQTVDLNGAKVLAVSDQGDSLKRYVVLSQNGQLLMKNNLVAVADFKFGGNTGGTDTTGPKPYLGGAVPVRDQISRSGGKVKLTDPATQRLVERAVVVTSVRNQTDPAGNNFVIMNDMVDTLKTYMVLSKNGQMWVDSGMVVVGLYFGGPSGGTNNPPQFVPYRGDSLTLTNVISASLAVSVMSETGGAPTILNVTTSMIVKEVDPMKPTESVWVIRTATDSFIVCGVTSDLGC